MRRSSGTPVLEPVGKPAGGRVAVERVILVTGAAGFIGFHLCTRLLTEGRQVVGVDNLNPYYDVTLKEARLERLQGMKGFIFRRLDVADAGSVRGLFSDFAPARVVHLAAQAGVRYSLTNPDAYVQANVVGFLNILEGCRHGGVEHLVYASSSSVYGANKKLPFGVADPVNHPVSLYAATKRSNELFAHSYSHLFGLPTTGLRFFTVYGPWGRPDMALFLFTRSIIQGLPLDVFNEGRMVRDFTYVDDIVKGTLAALERVPSGDQSWDAVHPRPDSSSAPWRIYNLGNSQPTELMKLIEEVERCVGRKAELRMLPNQPGDVTETSANVTESRRDLGFEPSTPIEVGVPKFVEWYRSYYGSR
jgi:UDP-glucuronate 4-epimerase